MVFAGFCYVVVQIALQFIAASKPYMPGIAQRGAPILLGIIAVFLALFLGIILWYTAQAFGRLNKSAEKRFIDKHGFHPKQKFAPTKVQAIAIPQQAESLAPPVMPPARQIESPRQQPRKQVWAQDDPNDVIRQGKQQLHLEEPEDFDDEEDELYPPPVTPIKRQKQDDGRPFVDSKVGGDNAQQDGKATEPSIPDEPEEAIIVEEEPGMTQTPKGEYAQRPITPIFRKKETLGFLDLTDVLKDGFMPTADKILLGVSSEGKLLTEKAADLWHILAGGPSGGGKSTFQRLIQAQLMSIGAQCYMSNIHYNPYDVVAGIHWDMLEERLIAPVASEADETYELLVGVVQELEERRQKTKRGEMQLEDLVPFFVFVEELPGVRLRLDKEQLAKMEKNIAIILSEGRKYRICYSGVAQSSLVSMIGGDSGIRSNIMTGIYTGGHPYTGRVLLHLPVGKDRQPDEKDDVKIDEEAIKGGGMVYVKSLHHKPTLTRIPWVSDRSVEMLFKSPTTIARRADRQKAS